METEATKAQPVRVWPHDLTPEQLEAAREIACSWPPPTPAQAEAFRRLFRPAQQRMVKDVLEEARLSRQRLPQEQPQ